MLSGATEVVQPIQYISRLGTAGVVSASTMLTPPPMMPPFLYVVRPLSGRLVDALRASPYR